MLAEL